VLRVIEESADHRNRREKETDRVRITEYQRPLSRESPGDVRPDESSPGLLYFVGFR